MVRRAHEGSRVLSDGGTPRGGPDEPEPVPSRWTLLRDALAFQLKLFVDGIRDVVMMPISIGVVVLDLLGVGPHPGQNFYKLLEVGRRTEHWINLFGSSGSDALGAGRGSGIDTLVGRMERMVIQEYERGGITASAKKQVDRALDGLSRPPR